jgi:hypothetical protein
LATFLSGEPPIISASAAPAAGRRSGDARSSRSGTAGDRARVVDGARGQRGGLSSSAKSTTPSFTSLPSSITVARERRRRRVAGSQVVPTTTTSTTGHSGPQPALAAHPARQRPIH